MDKDRLPFGQTQTTSEELREHIDVAKAIEVSKEYGVSQPRERIHDFIDVLPTLLSWLEKNGRKFPWRMTTDPWEVYVAEILLQRTRAEAVDDIYSDFLEQFPNPRALYSADENTIRQIIHPLGFVNHRTKTFQEVGEIFCEEYSGEVPDSLEGLKRPWRVGEYSARACLIFSSDQTYSLVDTNFARVGERVFGFEMPRQPHKSKAVYGFYDCLVPSKPALARAFNLGLLDLAALICTPEGPDCTSCPINTACLFYTI